MIQPFSILRYRLRRICYGNVILRHCDRGRAKWLSRSDRNASKEYWDSALSGGLKTYLGGTVAVDSRNALMSVLINHYAPYQPHVLDLGCAGGSLARVLESCAGYLGVDISEYAVDQARQDPGNQAASSKRRVEFVSSDLCEFVLEKTRAWDVIVFNEVLYYLTVEHAGAQVARYCAALRPGGIICVSMKDDGKSHAIFKHLAKEYSWKEGLLWQSKPVQPEYRVRVNRERPAFLLAALAPHG